MAAIKKSDRFVDDAAYVHANSHPDLNSGCWIWGLAHFRNGYGAVSNRSERLAHRLSYRAHFGEIPAGKFVCHKCDTPSCVNPLHLFVGSHSENMKDMAKKGRHWLVKNPEKSFLNGSKFQRVSGERHGNAKMSAAQAAAIRKRFLSGEKLKSIVLDVGLSKSAVYSAATGRSYILTEPDNPA